jgi:endonuclease/exonuclease/phosphatase (EEP) superfamily protein YafD
MVWLVRALQAVAAILLLSTALGFGSDAGWVFDLFSHFRSQYLVSLVVLAVAAGSARSYKTAAACAVGALANLLVILPSYRAPVDSTPADAPLRVVTLNVNVYNDRFDLVSAFLHRENADLVLLIEVDEGWLSHLADLSGQYPWRVTVPLAHGLGMALVTRLPLRDHEIIQLADSDFPAIKANLSAFGRCLTVLGVHLSAPVSPRYARARNAELEAMASVVRGTDIALVLGDFNVSPWSASFRRLLQQTGLRDAARGFGLQPTWPAGFVPLQIPIDHVLHSPNLGVGRFRTGPDVGSDHYGLIVDLGLTRSE